MWKDLFWRHPGDAVPATAAAAGLLGFIAFGAALALASGAAAWHKPLIIPALFVAAALFAMPGFAVFSLLRGHGVGLQAFALETLAGVCVAGVLLGGLSPLFGFFALVLDSPLLTRLAAWALALLAACACFSDILRATRRRDADAVGVGAGLMALWFPIYLLVFVRLAKLMAAL